jgi:dTDP-4-dehydrorhamnose reductase
VSWYNYARLIFELAHVDPELKPTDEREYRTAARRPRYSALSNEKMERAGVASMPALREAISQYLELRKNAKPHRSA